MRATAGHPALPRPRLGLSWPLLGLLGTTASAAAATNLLTHRPIHWWWRFRLLTGHSASWHLFWAGVLVLCIAWIGLGRKITRGDASVRSLAAVGALWAIPLALGPVLFSLDLYSYLADGSLLHHGLNPYRVGPVALGGVGATPVANAVSTNWLFTTAPYGPLFVWLVSPLAGIAGSHVALGATLMRLPALGGMALLVAFVPRLARSLGADPARAVWLAVISPLPLLYLVGGGHNDALMMGLLVAGMWHAVERRFAAAVALCALATMVKLPALAGVLVVAAIWLRAALAEPRGPQVAAGRLLGTVLMCAGIVVATGELAGVGLSWISGGLISTPQAAHLAITPSTVLAVTIYAIGHGGAHAGVAYTAATLESAMATVALLFGAGLVAWLAWRARQPSMVRMLGLILVVAALCGPVAWPWYLSWGLCLLAADVVAQRSLWLPVAAVAGVFPIMAGGQVAIPLPHAPRMFIVYAIAAAVAVAPALARRFRRIDRSAAVRGRLAEPEAAG